MEEQKKTEKKTGAMMKRERKEKGAKLPKQELAALITAVAPDDTGGAEFPRGTPEEEAAKEEECRTQ